MSELRPPRAEAGTRVARRRRDRRASAGGRPAVDCDGCDRADARVRGQRQRGPARHGDRVACPGRTGADHRGPRAGAEGDGGVTPARDRLGPGSRRRRSHLRGPARERRLVGAVPVASSRCRVWSRARGGGDDRGPGGVDLGGASVVRQAREGGVASGAVAAQGRAFMVAAARVPRGKHASGAVVSWARRWNGRRCRPWPTAPEPRSRCRTASGCSRPRVPTPGRPRWRRWWATRIAPVRQESSRWTTARVGLAVALDRGLWLDVVLPRCRRRRARTWDC